MIAQVIGLIAVGFSILCYQMESKKKLLIVQMLSSLCFCLHYFLLNAWSGAVLNAVAILRNLVYYNKDKKFFNSNAWPIILCVVMAGLSLLTWEDWYSLIALTGLIINTLCMSLPNPQDVRKSILVTSPMVLVYNIFVFSIGGVINETLSIISALVGIVRYGKEKEVK